MTDEELGKVIVAMTNNFNALRDEYDLLRDTVSDLNARVGEFTPQVSMRVEQLKHLEESLPTLMTIGGQASRVSREMTGLFVVLSEVKRDLKALRRGKTTPKELRDNLCRLEEYANEIKEITECLLVTDDEVGEEFEDKEYS